RAGLDSESYDKVAAVWCSADRQGAMTAAKAGKPVDAPQCDNPVAAQFELGQAMGVNGTPAVYTPDGRQLGGYVPADRLIKMVDDGKI
ncbi:MAG: thioredoxin fold domain-containing protein, partial [Gammaproteobacteria bacterium]